MLLFLKLVVLIFFIFMSLFTFVSLVTHSWIQDNLEHKQGLWYYCNDQAQDCEPIKDHQRIINMGGIPAWHHVVAIGMVITCLLQVFGTLLFIVKWLTTKFRCIYIICLISLLVACICEMIAMSIYTQRFRHHLDRGYNWGTSFILGWLSFACNIVGEIILFIVFMLDRKGIEYY